MNTVDKLAIIFLLLAAIGVVAVDVCADDTTTIAAGIVNLQPAADLERATELASVFQAAASRHKLDPLLLVAISFRESSLRRSVEERRKLGALGELGLMQSHGAALRFRPADCDRRLVGARCQVETGAAFLSEARRQCGGSWWRWVAAYGMRACPSEERARDMVGAQGGAAVLFEDWRDGVAMKDFYVRVMVSHGDKGFARDAIVSHRVIRVAGATALKDAIAMMGDDVAHQLLRKLGLSSKWGVNELLGHLDGDGERCQCDYCQTGGSCGR
jgi:hypothetical protein